MNQPTDNDSRQTIGRAFGGTAAILFFAAAIIHPTRWIGLWKLAVSEAVYSTPAAVVRASRVWEASRIGALGAPKPPYERRWTNSKKNPPSNV